MTLACHSFAARQWLSRRPAALSTLLGAPAVEVRSSGEHRGLGLYAARSVSAFSLLLSDVPLVLMDPEDDLPELYHQFQHLSTADREHYMTLSHHSNPARSALLQNKLLQRGLGRHDTASMARVASIMQTNAFNIDIGDSRGSTHRALFPSVARINHSCAPNAHVCFYPPGGGPGGGARGRMLVHALRDLQPGDEILIAYFSILLPRAEREAKAQKWGFVCQCLVCDASSADADDAEALRTELRVFVARRDAAIKNPPRSSTSKAIDIEALTRSGQDLIARIQNMPELFPILPDLSDGLGVLQTRGLARQRGREERRDADGVSFREQAVLWEARITGSESPATKGRLRQLAAWMAGQGCIESPKVIVDSHGCHTIAY